MTDFLKERKGKHRYKSPRADGNQDFEITDALIEEFRNLQARLFADQGEAMVWGIFGDNDPIAHFEPMFLEHYHTTFHFLGAHTPKAEEIREYYVPIIERMMGEVKNEK